MSDTNVEIISDNPDHAVDTEIASCLSLEAPRSFFLFAGAGSGKTRSLVTALQYIQKNLGKELRLKGQRVGVITYTNAASDEIKSRLQFDPLIDVRTIHSFAWSLIDGFDRDIREWLRLDIAAKLETLEKEEAKGRKGTSASATRLRKIESRRRRLGRLDHIQRFIYSPVGDNSARDALNHAEVLQLTSRFLSTKPAMQSILVGRYPILLVDESQDTNKHLVDALFTVQAAKKGSFTLGLLGDMMQRIYNEGKEGLGEALPADWATPAKTLNYRCPRRVVTLINKVRRNTDGQQQEPRDGADDGIVRLFILAAYTEDKAVAERLVAGQMAEFAEDELWTDSQQVKTLTLEHRMAAMRMGFHDMFAPLYSVQGWHTSLLEGKLPATRFFAEQVLPLVTARRAQDRFGLARITKAWSPLLTSDSLKSAPDKKQHLKRVAVAIDKLYALWDGGADPTLKEVLGCVAESGLLEIPEILGTQSPDPVLQNSRA